MLSEILTILGDVMDQEIGSLCLSDEEMLCAVEMFNDWCAKATKTTTFSLDVSAMFPSFVRETGGIQPVRRRTSIQTKGVAAQGKAEKEASQEGGLVWSC